MASYESGNFFVRQPDGTFATTQIVLEPDGKVVTTPR